MKNMVNKIFLDTNIILDYTLARKGELEDIENIFGLAEKGKLELFVSESVISTSFYFLQKNKLDALLIIRELSPLLNIITFKKDILFFPLEKYKDTEDALLYYIAASGKMNYFITRNVKHFVFTIPSLPVITPSRFLKEIYRNDLP
jgi:predicted nucleic acid-binding protein